MSRLQPLPRAGSVEYARLVQRRPIAAEPNETVGRILADVRRRGDRAVLDLTAQLDGVRLATTLVELTEARAALAGLEPRLRTALTEMARRIELVHRAQQNQEPAVDVGPAIRVWREWRPFQRVGLYVPGGRTVYPSSVLMMAVPARLAGCREIVLCSPPQSDGHLAASVLAAAALVGVTEIHAAGGAQAVAAMAYGTETVRRVDMIAGPGNAYVTAAKLAVFGEVAIDMPAGPSEVVIISDGSLDPRWIAADLRAQAEHSPDASAILLTTSENDAPALEAEDARQVHGFLAPSIDEAIAFANAYAPEHLSLACREAERHLPSVTAAGAVFLGPYAAAAAGDYATGANHVLPTGGSARSFGALGLRSFGRFIQVQEVKKTGANTLAQVTDVMAAAENLPAHGLSVRMRSQG